MKKIILMMLVMLTVMRMQVQTTLKKVYDESIDPMEQIDKAVLQAKACGKYVVCQVGGNWCPWCLRFADFISRDSTVSRVIADNFVYIHVNYNPRRQEGEEQAEKAKQLMQRLGEPARSASRCSSSLILTGRSSTYRTRASSKRDRGITKKRCCGSSGTGRRQLPEDIHERPMTTPSGVLPANSRKSQEPPANRAEHGL